MVDQVTINEAALNEGGGLTFFASSSAISTALVAATITYVSTVYSAPVGAEATISSSVNQGFAAQATPLGQATIPVVSDFLLTKVALSSASADAELLATPKAPDGGAGFTGEATFPAVTAFFTQPMASVFPAGEADFEVLAEPFKRQFGIPDFDLKNYPQEYTSYMVADVLYTQNGAGFSIEYTGTDKNYYGRSTVQLSAQDIKVFSDAWLPFGSVTFDVTDNYKFLSSASFHATCEIEPRSKDQFFDTPTMLATADCQPTEQKTAIAAADVSAPATFPAVVCQQILTDSVLLDCSDTFIVDPNPVILADGGYVYFDNDDTTFEATALMTFAGNADMLAVASIQESSTTYTVLQGEALQNASAGFWAFPSIFGFDVFVVQRPAEVKDFVRSAETKDFVRAKA